jgi:hypothetical protein
MAAAARTKGNEPGSDFERLTINVPRELKRWLLVHAAEGETTAGAVIVRLLEDYRRKADRAKKP